MSVKMSDDMRVNICNNGIQKSIKIIDKNCNLAWGVVPIKNYSQKQNDCNRMYNINDRTSGVCVTSQFSTGCINLAPYR